RARAALAAGRHTCARGWAGRRRQRGAGDECAGGDSREPAAVPQADRLALRQRARDHGVVHRLGLHALGRGVGRRAGHHRADRLVLAGAPGNGAGARAGAKAMKPVDDAMLDARHLPSYAFGSGSLMWWSTMGLMLIEGTVFGIGIMMYFYLRGVSAAWPIDAPAP